MNPLFITGGTGYLGRALIGALLAEGCDVSALARAGSEGRLPAGARPITGDALDDRTFASAVPRGATLVHLVGTPHPNPRKALEFQRVDLASIRASVRAAERAAVRHLVYVSVAHPAPMMKAYIAARREGESLVRASGIPATILRPWYVLGPGHRWPYLLVPAYAMLRWFRRTRGPAERLGLVTHRQMVTALAVAATTVPDGVRIVDVPAIRRGIMPAAAVAVEEA